MTARRTALSHNSFEVGRTVIDGHQDRLHEECVITVSDDTVKAEMMAHLEVKRA